jgi:uncharacterized SAM-binding protein YcdF (DUF218 family)
MFFLLSKILGFFLLPSNAIMALGIAGLVLIGTRRARTGRVLTAAALVLFAVFGLSPAGDALMEPLEDRFPPWDPGRGPPTGIVVLGGAVDPDLVAARGAPDINEAAERIIVVAALARTYPRARIIYSGGNARIAPGGGNEAEAVAPILESFGVAMDRVTLEARSRNTAENAVYSKELAAPRAGERWLIVTSGYHMPRAVGAFRKVGFDVEAYPVDYRTRGPAGLLTAFNDTASGLRRTDTAAREWIGLLAYWLTGRTSELFPRPMPG